MESLGKNVFFNDTSWILEFVSLHNLNIAWLEKMLDFLKPFIYKRETFIKGKHFAVRNRGKFDFDHHFAFWIIFDSSIGSFFLSVQNGPSAQIL